MGTPQWGTVVDQERAYQLPLSDLRYMARTMAPLGLRRAGPRQYFAPNAQRVAKAARENFRHALVIDLTELWEPGQELGPQPVRCRVGARVNDVDHGDGTVVQGPRKGSVQGAVRAEWLVEFDGGHREWIVDGMLQLQTEDTPC